MSFESMLHVLHGNKVIFIFIVIVIVITELLTPIDWYVIHDRHPNGVHPNL